MLQVFDQEKYDEWVAKGFNPVAAAFAAGANSTTIDKGVDEHGSHQYQILVEVPK